MIKLVNSLSLSQAAKLLPPGRNGRPVSTSTLVRWIIQGLQGPDNEIVRLTAVRLGFRWVTDENALQKFVESLTPKSARHQPSLPPTTRRRASDCAEHELEKRGF